jgi:hypothetical protein
LTNQLFGGIARQSAESSIAEDDWIVVEEWICDDHGHAGGLEGCRKRIFRSVARY